jgi:hypothetical protein
MDREGTKFSIERWSRVHGCSYCKGIEMKKVTGDAIIIIMIIMVVAPSQIFYTRSIDLVGKSWIAWILKDNDNPSSVGWQNVFNQSSPKEGPRESPNDVVLGWIIGLVFMFGNGRRRSQGFKWIKNRQVLK